MMKSRTCITCTNYIENHGYPICARTIVHWSEWDPVLGERKRHTRHGYCEHERDEGLVMALFYKTFRGRALCTRYGLFWKRNVQLITSRPEVPAVAVQKKNL
jgi:hypothetical protein